MRHTTYLRWFALALALASFSQHAFSARPAFNCQCRDTTGEMRDIGSIDCVYIGNSPFMVRCEMAGNNPYWARLSEDAGCPTA